MGELETYRLADFIPFGGEAYARLFATHNAQFLPAPLIGGLIGLIALWAAWRGRRWALSLLVPAWVWVGWAWYGQSYATLNWAGARMAWVAWGQAGLLLGMAWLTRGSSADADSPAGRTGHALAAVGLLLYPLLDPLTGRSWSGVEVFGHAPEPTALVTLGFVLALGRQRAIGLLLPTLICLEGALTARVLGTPGWWVSAALAGACWLALLVDRLRARARR